MEPFTWLPAERYFHPLLNSIGAYQRITYRLRAVCDAQRQKLLLSGDIEQNPGPIAVLQMNVSCLTPSKLATLMAQGADIIAIQETWKSSEQIASMHTGDYVLYAQSRIGKGGGVAVLVRKTLRSKRIPLTIPQHDTSLEVVVVQVALDQNRDLIVASAYMRPPPQVTQSFRRLVNCLLASTPLLLCGDFNMHHPQWEPFLENSPSEVAAEFLELCTDAGLTLVNTPGEITYARGTRERSCIDLTWSKHLTVSDWSASVSPLSDHYMLTFTLHQAFKIPYLRHLSFSTVGGSASGIYSSRTSTHNFRHMTIRSSPPALKLSRERLLLHIDDIAPAACTRTVPGFGRHSHGGRADGYRQQGPLSTVTDARP
ncbi:putative Endonuclease-reverse transcriptase [Trypanosoma cruzi]|uniref:Putative Endonuclease-reverse transcriptase n=1 Tax=Trypanosoma cruzi TaxID=5693 RepID=A0A2V2UJC1_TRYCR|nr:putative Endonuclease-reverse transcriptase [Trypanosoma cruzi]